MENYNAALGSPRYDYSWVKDDPHPQPKASQYMLIILPMLTSGIILRAVSTSQEARKGHGTLP